MYAYLDTHSEDRFLKFGEGYNPTPGDNEIKIRVTACGICRTDLHIIDRELNEPRENVIPGHQIVGIVMELGKNVTSLSIGQKVGIPWLGKCCNECEFCKSGKENLCDKSEYTGYQRNGGMSEYCVADADFCFPIPNHYPDVQAAPLLCAGLIGYRALQKIPKDAKSIGFYGFGSSAHILTQVCNYCHQDVYAFTRNGDQKKQNFALSLGAKWAGGSDEFPPIPLDAAIIFASEGKTLINALKAVKKGGCVICAGIYMSDIPSFQYNDLWMERRIESVANLTKQDGREFLTLAPQIPIETHVNLYSFKNVNKALDDLRHGRVTGSLVVIIDKDLQKQYNIED
ncbi:hypothetical protein WA158_004185 [Blastocystis sp. Blastoise]